MNHVDIIYYVLKILRIIRATTVRIILQFSTS